MTRAHAILTAGAALLAACRAAAPAPAGGPTHAARHAAVPPAGSAAAADTGAPGGRQAVHLTPAQARALGVAFSVARRAPLSREIRTVGQIESPEPSLVDVTPKVDGYVERLFVSATGDAVRRGEPLLTIYSPTLVAAQEELLTARRLAAGTDTGDADAGRAADALLAAARRRLAYWDVTPDQIARIERTGAVAKTLTLVAPVSGIVLQKQAVEGQQVAAGVPLYRIADLSRVWIEGEVFEQDLRLVRVGERVHIEVAAYPGDHLMGTVSFVYPTVNDTSRTNRVRVTVANPGLTLKPGMFATMYFDARLAADALVVPREAVIVTGERNLVFVKMPDGMLEPREVVLGARTESQVEVLRGLRVGDSVVTAANFLVDAESRLGGAAAAMPGMAGMGTGPAPAAGARAHD